MSGMTRRSKVYGFFTLNENWDPSLGLVMFGAILVNLITFSFMQSKKGRPIFVKKFNLPKNVYPDAKLIFGAATFGVGWGICGMCPGPAMINSINFLPSIIWLPSLAIGQLSWEGTENLYKYVMKGEKQNKMKND